MRIFLATAALKLRRQVQVQVQATEQYHPPPRTAVAPHPHLQLLHRAVLERGGVLPLAVALHHAEVRIQVKGLQAAGAAGETGRHLRGGPRGVGREARM